MHTLGTDCFTSFSQLLVLVLASLSFSADFSINLQGLHLEDIVRHPHDCGQRQHVDGREKLLGESERNLAQLSAVVSDTLIFSLQTNEINSNVADPVDGNWSPWSAFVTPCINLKTGKAVQCGGGVMLRHRSCTDPEPRCLR